MQNARLDEAQAWINIAGRNINNLRYPDDTTLMVESKEELKSLLMKVKEENEKAGLKLNIQKTKIMVSSSTSSVQSLSHVWLFATPWTTTHQASLSITTSWSLPRLMSIELVMPSNHLILCCPSEGEMSLLSPQSFPASGFFFFKWVSSLHQVAKVLEFQLQYQSSGFITFWQIDGETMETVTDLIFLGFKITTDGDSSHEIKRCLLLGKKAMKNTRQCIKKQTLLSQQRSV